MKTSARTAYAAVTTHIQTAVRGRVRSATTTSTVRWLTNAPGIQGQSCPPPLSSAVTGLTAMDSQNAPIGRVSVAATGSAHSRPLSSALASPPGSLPETAPISRVSRAIAPTTACGSRSAAVRVRAGTRRRIGPVVGRGPSGR